MATPPPPRLSALFVVIHACYEAFFVVVHACHGSESSVMVVNQLDHVRDRDEEHGYLPAILVLGSWFRAVATQTYAKHIEIIHHTESKYKSTRWGWEKDKGHKSRRKRTHTQNKQKRPWITGGRGVRYIYIYIYICMWSPPSKIHATFCLAQAKKPLATTVLCCSKRFGVWKQQCWDSTAVLLPQTSKVVPTQTIPRSKHAVLSNKVQKKTILCNLHGSRSWQA